MIIKSKIRAKREEIYNYYNFSWLDKVRIVWKDFFDKKLNFSVKKNDSIEQR
jgi:hypothetical protein